MRFLAGNYFYAGDEYIYAGERVKSLKCGCHPHNADELEGLTKNMLDHLKNCTPFSCNDSSVASGSGSSVASGRDSSCASKVVERVPGMKTLDSFVKRTGKKVGEQTKTLIRKRTATLVAAAQLPYRFVEQESLKDFAQAFVDLGAGYGHVSASDFIAGRKTVRSDIVKTFGQIQGSIRELIAGPSKLGAVSFVSDLWSDSVVQRSYLDVTFFLDRRIRSR